MIGSSFKFESTTNNVKKAADEAGFRNVGHAAASIRKTAIASILNSPAGSPGRDSSTGRFTKAATIPSQPGKPPFTRKGSLRRAIRFDANKLTGTAVIGPQFSLFGTAGHAHEFGGRFKENTYPERPFMGPALLGNITRFGNSFAGSIGG